VKARTRATTTISTAFIAGVEGDKVRLSANADVAVLDETEDDGKPLN
jgi:hypothetical protein